jgi:formaldehyde-activating enzyme involved in methanogenesis
MAPRHLTVQGQGTLTRREVRDGVEHRLEPLREAGLIDDVEVSTLVLDGSDIPFKNLYGVAYDGSTTAVLKALDGEPTVDRVYVTPSRVHAPNFVKRR